MTPATPGAASIWMWCAAFGPHHRKKPMKSLLVTTRPLTIRLDRGQGMVEYGLILGVVSLAGLAGLLTLGPKILTAFQTATTAFGA